MASAWQAGVAGKQQQALARHRLERDLREILLEPLGTVAARPLENDLFEWHANICPSDGPLAGVVFHLVLRFPEDYPTTPPKLRFPGRAIPAFHHPNVFSDSFVCLDMLSASGGGCYGGWSSAYTVQSILLQLQSFLLEDRIPQEGGAVYHLPRAAHTLRQIREQAAQHVCLACGHRGTDPRPAVHRTGRAAGTQGIQTVGQGQKLVSDELWAKVFEALLPVELLHCRKVQQVWGRTVDEFALLAKVEMLCFHSKVRVGEKETVLGVGITINYHTAQAPFLCPSSGTMQYHDAISEMHVVLDLISCQAFQYSGVRAGVWKEPFEHFMPLVLNPAHAQLMRPVLQRVVCKLAKAEAFAPWQYLVVLPQLMNSFVVELLHDQVMSDRISRANSERAVQGYCAFHHLLLWCATEHPELGIIASRRFCAFTQSETERSKAGTPDLGQFLALCAIVCESRWADLAKPYLQESLTRNVRRLFQHQQQRAELLADGTQQSRLAQLERREGCGLSYEQEAELSHLRRKFDAAFLGGGAGDPRGYSELRGLSDGELERYWFQSTKTGKRLLMFQVAFMRAIGRPTRRAENLTQYNRRWGLPTEQQREGMFKSCQEIMRVDSWEGFFGMLGMAKPPSFADKLRQAINVSAARRYHFVRYADAEQARRAKVVAAPYSRPAGGVWEVLLREAAAVRRGDSGPFASRPAAEGGKDKGDLPSKGAGKGGYKTQLCRYFAQGRCDKGGSCTYAHGARELASAGASAGKATGKGSCKGRR